VKRFCFQEQTRRDRRESIASTADLGICCGA
jgi:hypothetical protein